MRWDRWSFFTPTEVFWCREVSVWEEQRERCSPSTGPGNRIDLTLVRETSNFTVPCDRTTSWTCNNKQNEQNKSNLWHGCQSEQCDIRSFTACQTLLVYFSHFRDLNSVRIWRYTVSYNSMLKTELSQKVKLSVYWSVCVPALTYCHCVIPTTRMTLWIIVAQMSFLLEVAAFTLVYTSGCIVSVHINILAYMVCVVLDDTTRGHTRRRSCIPSCQLLGRACLLVCRSTETS